MKRSTRRSLPKARKNDLVTRQIPGELLVYDLKRNKAFCLNDTAATIWKNCNGKRTVAELAAALEKHQTIPVDEQIVWLALDQLEKSSLLQMKPAKPFGLAPISRRSLIRAGIVTAITLPLVNMISAPAAAQAGSGITQAVCQLRKTTDPGGCGGNSCLGKICKQAMATSCDCL